MLLAAAVQMTSGADKVKNLATAERLIRSAAAQGARGFCAQLNAIEGGWLTRAKVR